MNNRRKLLLTLASALASPLASFAQKQAAKVYRVGILIPSNAAAVAHLHEAFKQGLREHGYVEGQNIIFERRFAEGRVERLSELAAELVRMKVDVIVVATDPGVAAVKLQTQTIAIVMANSTDPVGTGFVTSLARPGGNITGLSTTSPELSGKRLELLKEVLPDLLRVAIVWNPDIRGAMFDYKETESAARSLRLQLQSVEVTRADDLERAFSAVKNQRAQVLIVQTPNPVLFANPSEIANVAQRNRLPSMYGQKEYADAGGLMSYGPVNAELWRRSATYVHRILKGAKPGDLPVEQPTRFELVINLKTAKALGMTIPQSVLSRADKVIPW